ncbi:hypothetical protein ON010_g10308 [Phytophthora cinnamomi]|nr:hypothetical protein ON010_g10308 [Phytophthora cinnamomi]
MSSHPPGGSLAQPSTPSGDRGSPPAWPRSAHSVVSSHTTRSSSEGLRRIALLEQERLAAYASQATLKDDRSRLNATVSQLTAEPQNVERYRWEQDEEMRRLHAEIDDFQQGTSGTGCSCISRLCTYPAAAGGHSGFQPGLEHDVDLATSEIVDLRLQMTPHERDLDLARHDLDVTTNTLDRVQLALAATESGTQPASPTQTTPRSGTPASATLRQEVDRLEADLRQARGGLSPIRSACDAAQARVASLEA